MTTTQQKVIDLLKSQTEYNIIVDEYNVLSQSCELAAYTYEIMGKPFNELHIIEALEIYIDKTPKQKMKSLIDTTNLMVNHAIQILEQGEEA